MAFLKSVLPSKLSAAQRTAVKLAKINQKAGKTAIKEAGKTARDIVSVVATNRTIQQKIATDAAKKYENDKNDSVEKALQIYENIIKGNPEQSGGTGTESTTEIGSSGSKLNG